VGGLPTSTVNGFAVHPKTVKVMFVAMREGIFRSDDGGATWKRLSGSPKDTAAITIHPVQPTTIYVATTAGHIVMSGDEGRSWTPVEATP
jgi:photosystem II stability/assembly factor-like uncharacterized protein